MTTKPTKRVRCAVYTRVSTEYGLDQEFNSLDAQHEAAEAYARSQTHDGWTLVRTRYDDGGYSGGSTERPALQRLLTDIRDRRIDVVVVYKVDRLTRSLADFAKLVELFDAHGVSFVSVTQQFNTTTSMGRLTLNVLLSFAQFEREVTGERIRDKIGASKRRGLWVGGMVPLGYVTRDKKLFIEEEEAERVHTIFRRYLDLGSIGLLLADLRERSVLAGPCAMMQRQKSAATGQNWRRYKLPNPGSGFLRPCYATRPAERQHPRSDAETACDGGARCEALDAFDPPKRPALRACSE
jgi:DNA invertase Pin-like site-specific DNA recombinase